MRQRAFTLIELLVSLSVLLVVIIATARIFGTTGKVAAIGEASADLQATATAVEKVIRGDIERIARDGVLAIQCVAVRNDVNRYQRKDNDPSNDTSLVTSISSTAPLLNPTLASTDFVRCDQIVFFARGLEASQVFLGTQGGAINASRQGDEYAVYLFDGNTIQITPEITSNEFMVRLGHGLQFPSLLVDVNNPTLRPDADTLGSSPGTLIPLVPWMWSSTPTLTSANFDVGASSNKYMAGQPEARQWVMSRQITLLADDGNTQSPTWDTSTAKNVTWFHGLGGGNFYPNSATGIAQYDFQSAGTAPASMSPQQKETSLSIPHDKMFPNRAILSSRVDTAATSIAEYRAFVETGSTSANLAKDFSFDRTNRLFWSDEEGADPSGSLKLGNIHNRIFNSLFGGNIPISSTLGRTNGLWGYPRAEKVAPSMDRRDSKVSIPLLAGNCSSIQIDWTWSNRTAQFETPEGTPILAQLPISPFRPAAIYDVPLAGLTTQEWPLNQPFKYVDDSAISPLNTKITPTALGNSIPWFGLPDSMFPLSQRRGVTRLAGPLISDKLTPLSQPSYATPIKILKPSAATDSTKNSFTPTDIDTVAVATPPIDCARIEGVNAISNPQDTSSIKYSVYTYQAIFGPNGDKPYREAKFPGGSERVLRTDYTPWPTALRFTITLHDPKLALSQGRVFQFVVELPKAEK
jgi:prepilin-type N-terminal cleavage/methylation domain-containing protein